MAIMELNKRGLVSIGNRNDSCYLCLTQIKGKDEIDYNKQVRALRGVLEGRPVVKIRRGGTDTIICMKCIHKIATEHPLKD